MTWRVHVSDSSIRKLQHFGPEPTLLAVTTQTGRIAYFEQVTGAPRGHLQLHPPRSAFAFDNPVWRSYLDSLGSAGNGACPPLISLPQLDIYSTVDGGMRLLHAVSGELIWLGASESKVLMASGDLLALDMDRSSGRAVTLNSRGQLRIYDAGELLRSVDIGLRLDPLSLVDVKIGGGGARIFVTDGRQIVALDEAGGERGRLRLHYGAGSLAVSPSGEVVLCSDNGAGLIRAYRGADLMPTHQRFAQDLLAEAQQVQLMAELPPFSIAISALAASDDGTIAFAMSGVVCVSSLDRMTTLVVTGR